jgi:hypothetical protein
MAEKALSFEEEFAAFAAERDTENGIQNDPVIDDVAPADEVGEQDAKTVDEAGVQEDVAGLADGNKDPEDPYAGLTEAAKARLIALEETNKSLQHRVSSDAGRVSAFQRKINELTTQIDAIGKKSGGEQPTKKEVVDAMADGSKWEAFKQEYPEVADAMDSRFSEISSKQNKQIETVLAPVIVERQQKDAEKAYGAVADVFPTWQNAVKEQPFQDWLASQPAAVQTLAESLEVADATSLIGLYDNHRIVTGLPSLKKSDPVSGKEGVDTSGKDSVAERRERQKQAGVTVQSKSARVDPNADSESDFDAAFNAYAKRRESQRR